MKLYLHIEVLRYQENFWISILRCEYLTEELE